MRTWVVIAVGLLGLSRLLSAQTTNSTAPSDSPERLAYVIPNNRTVEHDEKFAPIPASTKFHLAAEDAFDPYSFVSAGVNAAVEQATNDHPQYGQGIAGFAKRYSADFTDEATSELLGGGIFPILLHQDTRYFRLQRGGIWKRSGYALSRSFITYSDRGTKQFNTSNVLGEFGGAAVSNLYYPAPERTFGQTMQRGGILLFEDAAFNLLKEFWPDVHDRLRHRSSSQ